MNKIEQIRQKTYDDVINKLREHHKCIIIRPTGYGKTWLLTELIGRYKNVLYLYPTEIIAETVKNRYYALHGSEVDEETVECVNGVKDMKNVTMMTYAKLIRLSEDDFKAMDYDCIITDEAHRIGGMKTKIAMSRLMYYCYKADFIGATATPNRTDGFDVVNAFYSNIMTFPYTLHDGMRDGMFKKPNYCYCTADVREDLKEAALTAGEDLDDPVVKDVIKKTYVEMAKLFNMDNIIRKYCDEYVENTSYMKFIIFFANKKQMTDKLDDVKGWFKSAYPGHTIESLEISTRNGREAKNVRRLENLKEAPDTIQLIACIDMLNMGYHVNDLTGILMYRGTKSDIIYIQQLGRVLSSGADSAALVFDVVDNIHRLAVYEINDLNGNKMGIGQRNKKNGGKINRTTIWRVVNKSVIDSEGNPAPFRLRDDGVLIDLNGNETNLMADEDGNIIDASEDDGYIAGTEIGPDDVNRVDLMMEGHMATYRELLAKAVAEPMSQRCRIAVNIHFEKWCKAKGIAYPISDTDRRWLETAGKKEFNKYYQTLIATHNLNYPLQDAQKLMNTAPYGVTIEVCAKAKNVSIKAILDLIEAA